jgi:mannose-6-phosphate isomerase class I
LKEWKAGDAEVLRYSTAYYCTPGEGFFLKSGILHAPGSVLTFELQESSDVCGFFQPKVGNYQMDKRMLFKDVAPEEIEKWGPEKAALRQVDWQANTDPNFYDKYHLFPRKCTQTEQHGLFETWIFYGTPKFSGKRLILPPHTTFHCVERGVHNLFCWKGEATVGGKRMKAGCVDLQSCEDELLVCDERARKGYDIVNVGDGELCIYKIFGPELNDDIVPAISQTGT